MTWTWPKRGNLKRETESLLTSAQNDVIRTKCVKAKTDNIHQNSKCGLCGDSDETLNQKKANDTNRLKKYKTMTAGKCDPQGILLQIEIWPF